MGNDDELVELVTTSSAVVPDDIRADWERYLDRTVLDLWGRPGLAPRDRSLVTVVALTVAGSRTELDAQIRLALRNGLARLELCEAMVQLGGYAGLGRGVEGMSALQAVFDDEPDLGADPGDLPTGVPGDVRLDRARFIQRILSPAHVDEIFERLTPYPEDVDAATRPPFRAGRTEWLGWLTETAFGDLWSRPNLEIRQRELVVATALMTLGGRNPELRSHFNASLGMGITPEEMSEAIVQVAVYAGFPSAVEAMLLYHGVLAENGLADPPRQHR